MMTYFLLSVVTTVFGYWIGRLAGTIHEYETLRRLKRLSEQHEQKEDRT